MKLHAYFYQVTKSSWDINTDCDCRLYTLTREQLILTNSQSVREGWGGHRTTSHAAVTGQVLETKKAFYGFQGLRGSSLVPLEGLCSGIKI